MLKQAPNKCMVCHVDGIYEKINCLHSFFSQITAYILKLDISPFDEFN
jgi:hypothetical protein